MKSSRPRLRLAAAFAVALSVGAAVSAPASAAPKNPNPETDTRAAAPPRATARSVGAGERAPGWDRSADRAWTTSGDADGFHLLVADEAKAYEWRTIATLAEPGLDADSWIGNVCVTGSAHRAVVAYAPRTFTNKTELFDRGAFTAVVDLDTGAVRKLPVRTSLAYFNPSCGTGDSAVLTQAGDEDLGKTRLLRLDAASGKLAAPVDVAGQLTSAVPTAHGLIGATKDALVRVTDTGALQRVAPASGVPYALAADADGGVVYLDHDGTQNAKVRRAMIDGTGSVTTKTLATGARTALGVTSGRGGRVAVTGVKKATGVALPAAVSLLDVPKDATVSTEGRLAVTEVVKPGAPDPRQAPAGAQAVNITATVLPNHKQVTLVAETDTAPAAGRVTSPAPAGTSAGATTNGSPTDPSDSADRYCSVPRTDPRNQAMQPKPRQVEWAVDQAVRGALTVQRPSNWKNLGMPAYTPQGLFPKVDLAGGGFVPAQVMLGITAQESNMWQAARSSVPGTTGNPLIGNYYGINYYNGNAADDWTIDWAKADCGYGVTQVTDHMRLAGKEKGPGDEAWPLQTQRAVALDFAANVAAGLQIISNKWNEVRAAGLVVNNGDVSRIENWFFAIWAYNSGFHPASGSAPWGLGWGNNPANPRFLDSRLPFLEYSYADAAHPQYWPYPEKVLGWAGHPVNLIETPGTMVAGFRPSWWNTVDNRIAVKPPVNQFCDDSNECHPGEKNVPDYAGTGPDDPANVVGEPAGPCAHKTGGKFDLKCWYHQSNTWKPDCDSSCGYELLRFDPGYAYQEDANSYPPNCETRGLPSNALIVDDANGAPPVRNNCGQTWANAGSFQLSYDDDGTGHYPGKVDTHQLGGGFGGHFYFGHTRTSSVEGGRLKATGTWTLDNSLNAWARVLVHLPDIGAQTQQARYDINLGDGQRRHRYLNQQIQRNGWVSIGVYPFAGRPSVSMSTLTEEGTGDLDVAWDAIAFQPLPAKPTNIVAALGDSYSSGEGAGNYATESDLNHGTAEWNACRRSANAWPRKMVIPGSGGSLGTLSDQWNTNNELGFVACSGAMTWNVSGRWNGAGSIPTSWIHPEQYEKGEGQFHEINQVASGVLTPETTLVTLTIGGNDEGAFVNALMDCASITNCADDEYLPKYKAVFDRTKTRIIDTVRAIRGEAPNAQIVLTAYPEPLSRTVKCGGSWYFDLSEVHAIAELTGYVRDKEAEAVTQLRSEGIKVDAADPIGAFVGHGGCDDPEWINKIVLGPNGEGDFHKGDNPTQFCFWDVLGGACLSREMFHPNAAGTTGYAQVMEARLTQLHYPS
ncbi:hypothetical protein [Amycolatopsis vancoresmycina]|uniref:golvesin C-terminal-like domain-containing protein n=1 Tax=Amycolatopsis vancoresmycina TaxID=208444 RepID=UPI001969DF87|nr:hypothetical protein [Amycolatopsis vancoresmycina]